MMNNNNMLGDFATPKALGSLTAKASSSSSGSSGGQVKERYSYEAVMAQTEKSEDSKAKSEGNI